jgi:hypothetical protein
MKIEIALNKQSIKNAIKQLKQAKYNINLAYENFLEDVAMWLIDRANMYLNASDIGENVKIDIRNAWEYERTATGMKITNKDDQAVYVEFGVGIVGAQKQHINAHQTGYQYNVGKKIREDGTWIFNPASDEDIDIQAKYIINRGNTSVLTRGQPAVMYAYNAIVDIRVGDTLKRIWEKNKKRYIG